VKLFSRGTLRAITLIAFPLGGLLFGISVFASPVSDALTQLSTRAGANRQVQLSDLGFESDTLLQGTNAHQAYYIPVSEGVDLMQASFGFHAQYHKTDSALAGVVLSVDGKPQALDMADATTGEIRHTLALEPGKRKSRFIQVDVNWESDAADVQETNAAVGPEQCPRLLQNRLTIGSDSFLQYRYDTNSILTTKQAWEMLPHQPTLLVAGNPISKAGFDTAWRIGVILEQLGRHATVRSFPGVGDVVNLDGVAVPKELASIAAYASLREKSQITITDPAQIGALLTLGAPALMADIAVPDAALRHQIRQSLEALHMQLKHDPDAQQALATWRAQRMTILAATPKPEAIELVRYSTQAVISVGVGNAEKIAETFRQTVLPLLTAAERRTGSAALADPAASDAVDLLGFGPESATFTGATRADWIANVPLAALSSNGQMANRLVVNISAAPDPSGTPPVVTLFWNDILLDAMQLPANNQPKGLSARVPPYVMGVNNAVRVSVQRATPSASPIGIGDCTETGQQYAATIRSSSHIITGSPEPDGTFPGLLPLLMNNTQLFVLADYLKNPQNGVQTLVSLAASIGLSTTGSTLIVTSGEQPVEPSDTFVSLGAPVRDFKPDVTVDSQGLIQVGHRPAHWLPATDARTLSIAQVAQSGRQHGIVWYPTRGQQARLHRPFTLIPGTTVILGQSGVLSWLRGDEPAQLTRGPADSAFYEWRKQWSWGVPVIVVLLLAFLILLLVARYHRNKHDKSH